MQLHHVSLFVRDADASLAFYRDGLGMSVIVDREFDGDWPGLFGVSSGRLRAVVLGDPDDPRIGQVELVTFADPLEAGPPAAPVCTGVAMLAFHVDLESVLPAVEGAGASEVRRTTLQRGTGAATVRDPDGILVELLDTVPRGAS